MKTPIDILARLDQRILSAQAVIIKHQQDLGTNPAHAMQWADKVFTAAAEVSVFTSAKYQLGDANDPTSIMDLVKVADFVKEVEREIVRRAARLASSTSASANHMEDAERVAFTELWRICTFGF